MITPRRPGLISAAELLDPATVRPPGGTVAELHAHTLPHSLDSGVWPEKLVEQAAWRGLDLVVLTEHNALWDQGTLRDLSERCEVDLLAGMELGTDAGHILVYGLDHYSPELVLLKRLRPIVEAEGAAMVLAHPMRPLSTGQYPPWDEIASIFAGLEVVNGDHGDVVGGYYDRLAQDLCVTTIGGSDVHSREAVGRVATVFPERVRDMETLLHALHGRRARPADLRP